MKTLINKIARLTRRKNRVHYVGKHGVLYARGNN